MPGYIVVVVAAPDTSAQQTDLLLRLAHDTFTRAMHERISTSVVTLVEQEVCDDYIEKGGDPKGWPEALGGGFDPAWKVPYANAIVFGGEDVTERQARIVREALLSERMLAALREDGKLKKVTGLVGHRLVFDV